MGNTTYVKEKLTDNFTVLKIRRQCPLVPLVIAEWKLGKELRSDGFEAKDVEECTFLLEILQK